MRGPVSVCGSVLRRRRLPRRIRPKRRGDETFRFITSRGRAAAGLIGISGQTPKRWVRQRQRELLTLELLVVIRWHGTRRGLAKVSVDRRRRRRHQVAHRRSRGGDLIAVVAAIVVELFQQVLPAVRDRDVATNLRII